MTLEGQEFEVSLWPQGSRGASWTGVGSMIDGGGSEEGQRGSQGGRPIRRARGPAIAAAAGEGVGRHIRMAGSRHPRPDSRSRRARSRSSARSARWRPAPIACRRHPVCPPSAAPRPCLTGGVAARRRQNALAATGPPGWGARSYRTSALSPNSPSCAAAADCN